MEDREEYPKPAEAKDYYTRKRWWSEHEQAVNGTPLAATKHNSDHNYNLKEILTPKTPREGDLVVLNDMIDQAGDEDDLKKEHHHGQPVSSEIEEVPEDEKNKTVGKESGADDTYVAVGKDDMDVVKWALDHAVSPSSRVLFIHVSPPLALIPTPLGNLPRSQLNQQQVTSHENEEINRRNNILQKYLQLSNDAQVSAETLHLESNDTAKAILELIYVLNIKNLVMGIKKPPRSWGKTKLSRGEIVKHNAPEFCDVALVYEGNEVLKSSQHRHHSSGRFLSCLCFSGRMNEVSE